MYVSFKVLAEVVGVLLVERNAPSHHGAHTREEGVSERTVDSLQGLLGTECLFGAEEESNGNISRVGICGWSEG